MHNDISRAASEEQIPSHSVIRKTLHILSLEHEACKNGEPLHESLCIHRQFK